MLRILLEHYERNHLFADCLTGADALRKLMDLEEFEQYNLYPLFGSRSKLSEVLSGKRQLSKGMIQRLNAVFGIPAEVLLK